jgi:hypothetical protein
MGWVRRSAGGRDKAAELASAAARAEGASTTRHRAWPAAAKPGGGGLLPRPLLSHDRTVTGVLTLRAGGAAAGA